MHLVLQHCQPPATPALYLTYDALLQVYDCCFNPAGTQLIVACGNLVLMYDPTDGLLMHRLRGHKDTGLARTIYARTHAHTSTRMLFLFFCQRSFSSIRPCTRQIMFIANPKPQPSEGMQLTIPYLDKPSYKCAAFQLPHFFC